MKKITIPFLIINILLVGCSDQEVKVPNLEDIAMVGVMGYDYVSKDRMRITLTVAQPSPEAKENSEVFTEEGKATNVILNQISSMSERDLDLAQLRVVLFSKEFTEKTGIEEVVTELYRNGTTADKMKIGIVDGNIEELLSYNYKDKPMKGRFFNSLLDRRIRNAFTPYSNIHVYMKNVKGLEEDPSLPLIKKKGNQIEVEGVSVFKKDKLSVLLNRDEGTMIEVLKGSYTIPDFGLELDKEDGAERVVMSPIKNSSKIKMDYKGLFPKAKIDVFIEGGLIDYSGSKNLGDYKKAIELERQMEKRVREKMTDFLYKLQKDEVDPIGFGGYLRQKYGGKNWTEEKWREQIRNMEFDVNVNITLRNSGTIRENRS